MEVILDKLLGPHGVAVGAIAICVALWKRTVKVTDELIAAKGLTTEAAIKMADALKAAVEAFNAAVRK